MYLRYSQRTNCASKVARLARPLLLAQLLPYDTENMNVCKRDCDYAREEQRVSNPGLVALTFTRSMER